MLLIIFLTSLSTSSGRGLWDYEEPPIDAGDGVDSTKPDMEGSRGVN